MNIQTESTNTLVFADTAEKDRAKNPIQQRLCEEVDESAALTAEAVFTNRRLEVREEARQVMTMLFVP